MSLPYGRAAMPEQSPFARLAITHALAIGADTLVAVALAGSIFFSATLADARPKVLSYLAITMVPFAVVAPVMGPALDRTKGGRRLMVAVFALGRRCCACSWPTTSRACCSTRRRSGRWRCRRAIS